MGYTLSLNTFMKAVAHRGYSTIAPENTLPAYILAAQKGFRYVECDVSFTSDGVPVLLHDSTINRTSNGTGAINNLTLATVRTYDFGSWKSSAYTGTKIPTLEEFLVLCRNLGLHPYIEIKSDFTYTDAQIRSIVDMVNKYGLRNNASIISFSLNYLTIIKNYDPYIRIGYVVNSVTSTIIQQAETLQTETNEVFLDSEGYTGTQITYCSDANIPLEIWTIDNTSTILSLHDYVSGVTSNNKHAGFIKFEKSMSER